ncbi:MAG: RNA methyltransferase [Candidatus Babeliaceae bacterium]
MKIISSLSNPTIKRVVSLHETQNRQTLQNCIVEGIRAIQTFLEAHQEIRELYITQKWLEQAITLCPEEKINTVSDAVMKKISTATTPSGILAIFSIPSTKKLFIEKNNLPVVLAQIQDPGNMGTLIRTAAAFNKKNIIVVEGVDPWNPKVIQASAGTIALVSLFYYSWQQVVELKKHFHLAALTIEKGKKPEDIDYEKTVLIIGNEAHGLPREWQQDCNIHITLPMPGGTESLNAAVAGSIVLYIASK